MVSDHVLDLHVLDLIGWKIAVIEAAIENVMQGSPRQVQEVETAEVYEARMIATELVQMAEDAGIVIPDSVDDRLGNWPAIERDKDVPF